MRFSPPLPAKVNFRPGVRILSTTTTVCPSVANTSAAMSPAGPPPMTSARYDTRRTYCFFVVSPRFDEPYVRRTGFVERVLDVVTLIPRGKVMSYGDIAEYLGEGGPRQVARVMSTYGNEVPWHRVLRSNGTCAEQVAMEQLALLRQEPVVFDSTRTRVRMAQSRWDGHQPTRKKRSG